MIYVLVTGAGGQLGKSIKKIAIHYPNINFVFKTSKELDITKALQIGESFHEVKYQYCINCAAYTNVEKAENEEKKAFSINAEGVGNLAKTCYKSNVKLIHISTDYVFDGRQEEAYTIYDTPNPINVYGASKLKGEQNVQKTLEHYFIVRTSWLYSEFGNNFYNTILKKARAGEHLRITDQQIGCPTNAKNLAAYILELVNENSTTYGLHHFTDGKAMSWYDFAKLIVRQNCIGNEADIECDNNYSSFAKRPKNSVLQ